MVWSVESSPLGAVDSTLARSSAAGGTGRVAGDEMGVRTSSRKILEQQWEQQMEVELAANARSCCVACSKALEAAGS